jgi:excisionase family DNA binding protein
LSIKLSNNQKNTWGENQGENKSKAVDGEKTWSDAESAGLDELSKASLYCVEQPGSRPRRQMRGTGKIFENLTWLTSNEAAEYLRLPSVGALRVLVWKRQLPFHKLGRSLRFKRAELDRLLEVSRIGGP